MSSAAATPATEDAQYEEELRRRSTVNDATETPDPGPTDEINAKVISIVGDNAVGRSWIWYVKQLQENPYT